MEHSWQRLLHLYRRLDEGYVRAPAGPQLGERLLGQWPTRPRRCPSFVTEKERRHLRVEVPCEQFRSNGSSCELLFQRRRDTVPAP